MRTPLAVLACSLLACSSAAPSPAGQVSVILSALAGESQPFLRALGGRVDRSADSVYCSGVVEGALGRHPVVVVTTGTGGDNAGPCMQEILHGYGNRVREVIWSGIAGLSPAIGGLVDPSTGALRPDPRPVILGDVCVGVMTWSYDLHFSSVDDWRVAAEASGNLNDPRGGWWEMKSTSASGVVGFENVQQYVLADRALADEILAAAAAVRLARPTGRTLDEVKRFFSDAQIREPRVFDYRVCGGEVAANEFFHSAVQDRLARQYIASLIRSSGFAGSLVTENEVIAVAGMEGASWMSVVDRWASKKGTRIGMALVRAGSNYDHQPLLPNGRPAPDATGHVPTAMEDILIGFSDDGSVLAVENAAAVVLMTFARR